MGQKINPIGFRLQVNRTWDSRWFANNNEYGDLLLEDIKMREFIKKEAVQGVQVNRRRKPKPIFDERPQDRHT